jgi:hypothetical protein
VPPASSTSRDAHGSGTQAPSIWPSRNSVSACAFSVGVMCTSPPPVVSVASPFSFSQLRRATSCVLPSCGVAMVVPFRSLGDEMPSRTTSAAPPIVAPATMRAETPPDWMKVLIDGFGPMNVASIAPAEGLDGCRPGRERLRRERGVAQRLLEDPPAVR